MRHRVLWAGAVAVGLALTAGAPVALAQPDAAEGDATVARFDGDRVVRVNIRAGEDLLTMAAISDDPWTCRTPGLGLVDYRVSAARMADLVASGIPFVVLIENVQALIDAENARLRAARLEGGGPGVPAWFDDYKNLADISAYTNQLVAEFPTMASRISAGQSLDGREIFAIRIAAPGAPADRPAVFLHGLQHAREWASGATVMYIADRLLRTAGSDPAVDEALASLQFFIIPVSNPDGYNHSWVNNRMWRKNRRMNANGSRGVDTNRNWGVGWGLTNGSSGNQGSDTYRGTAAFSEPETQVLRDFALARPFIRAHFDVHAYSQLILSPNGYTPDLPANAALFTDLNGVLAAGFARRYGMVYRPGPTYTNIYPVSGGSTDWFFGARGALSWGVEVRDTGQTGFLLPPEQIVPNGEEALDAVLDLASAIARPIRFSFAPPMPALVEAGVPAIVPFTVWPMPGETLDAASVRVHTRLGRSGSFQEGTPTPGTGLNAFDAALPALPCGAEVALVFTARTTDGRLVTWPSAGEASPLIATGAERETPESPLVACAPCPGDFNRDGDPNPDDLSDYIAAYFTQPPLDGTDINGDGNTDPDDLSDYIAMYFGGCP